MSAAVAGPNSFRPPRSYTTLWDATEESSQAGSACSYNWTDERTREEASD